MSTLDETRKKIAAIDAKMLTLFTERMSLAGDVADYKLPRKIDIYDPTREKEILQQIKENAPEHLAVSVENFFSSAIRLSRELQYSKAVELDSGWKTGQHLRNSCGKALNVRSVSYGGKKGSYSFQAAEKLFPGVQLKESAGFDQACCLAAGGEADAAVLPLDNTTAGSVSGTGELLQKYGLYIFRSTILSIQHVLMAKPGTPLDEIKEVRSHPQALAQCAQFIREMGWDAVPMENTSFAAEYVAASPERNIAAIGSEDAAHLFSLEILKPCVNDAACNQTRFVAAAREMAVPENAARISIVFKLAHESGSLAGALAIFSDAGLNLTRIQSEPIPEAPWEYSFYLDFTAPALDKKALAALYQLEKESHFMRILGWYNEE